MNGQSRRGLQVLNQQPPEKFLISDGEALLVHSKWNTIQGEGLFAGTSASFIRLVGCNLQCPLCDTDYTSVRKVETVDSIINWIEAQNHKLVVLTGGEPFRQNLEKLVMSLFHDSDKLLQIETNGVFIPESFRTGDATVVCSPKTTKISKRAGEVVDAWKYVLRAGYIDLLDGLPISALGMNQSPSRPTNNSPIFVQPCDDKDPVQNRLNLKATVESCMKFGYRLCLQIHKIAEMD